MTDAAATDTPGSDTEPDTHESHSLVRSSAVVAIGTALSRLTGFGRIAAIAYAIGAGTLAGTYSYANETPNIVYELVLGGVLTATLVPLFVRHLDIGEDDASDAVVSTGLVVLFAVSVVGILVAPWLVDLYTLRVDGATRDAQRELATMLLRLFMPQMFFYGIVTFATAMLNARRRFVAAAFAPVLNNLVVIAVFLLLPHLVDGSITLPRVLADDGLAILLGVGTTAGVVVVALALVVAVRRAGVTFHFRPRWRHPAVSTMMRLSGWTVGYVVANQIALLVIMVLANDTSGGPFLYASAYAFFQLPHGLFTVSLMTTFTPELARAASRDDLAALRAQLARGLRLASVVLVPAIALYLGLARPLVTLLLERGAFSARDASLLADTVLGFAVGLLPFSTYLFALRAFYARQDTRTPFVLNCAQNAVNVALAFPLYAWLGIAGLAVAFSLSYLFAAVLTLAVLRRRLGHGDERALGSTLARMLVVGAVVAAATWAVADAIGWDDTAHALLATIVGGSVGVAITAGGMILLRVDEARSLRGLLGRARGAT